MRPQLAISLRRITAVALGLVLAVLGGCGSGSELTCGELRDDPARYATEAATLYKKELGVVPRSDCSVACERTFTKGIERRLRKECQGAAGDHEPERAIADWINSD